MFLPKTKGKKGFFRDGHINNEQTTLSVHNFRGICKRTLEEKQITSQIQYTHCISHQQSPLSVNHPIIAMPYTSPIIAIVRYCPYRLLHGNYDHTQ